VSGALLSSRIAIKTPPVGGEKCSRCDRLGGGGGVEWRVKVKWDLKLEMELRMKLILALE
jgi:hypothetical protein